jgi:prephenate dehydrogenase
MSVPVRGPVLVIGSGLLGASIGLALRRAGVPVWLDDVDADVLAEAIGRGAGAPWEPGLGEPALVVVAVPPSSAGAVMARATGFPGATVTDVTSVKAVPLAEAIASGADQKRLVGGHPMAGREMSGPAAARVDLFDDRPWVVTPLAGTAPERIQDVVDLATTCGGLALVMNPTEHDEAVALTSHAPQVISSLLAARLVDADARAVAVSGQGLRDMTRIAASEPALWQEILSANADSVVGVLDAFAKDLSTFVTDLRGGDRRDVGDALRRGAQGRERIPGKHGDAATAYDVVSAVVKDEPGELARLFVAAGELGVNLEDVRIDHVLGKPSGLIELSVRPESSARLRDGLTALGFDVRA